MDYKLILEPFKMCHALATEEAPLTAALKTIPEIAHTAFDELFHLGAVYLNHHRIRENQMLKAGDYVRVHLDPRRFSVAFDFKAQIFFENDHFLVFNKPSGIPVHATVDNWVENVIFQIKQELDIDLFVTHRIDIATSGLLVYAKTKTFQSQFNKLIRLGKVQKFYRAKTLIEVQEGEIIHYMQPSPRAPKIVTNIETPGYDRCHLTVQRCFKNGDDYEVDIELHTGRTHQIRAQLGYLGAPIVGDQMYGSISPLSSRDEIALTCSALKFIDPTSGEHWSFELPRPS